MRDEVEAEQIEKELMVRAARHAILQRKKRAASVISIMLRGRALQRGPDQMRIEAAAFLQAYLRRMTFPDYQIAQYYARNNIIDQLDIGTIRIHKMKWT